MKINDTVIRELGKHRRWNPAKCVPLTGLKWLVGLVAAMICALPWVLWFMGGW